MSTLPQLIEVPFQQNSTICPVCHEILKFRAVVEITDAVAETTGEGSPTHTDLSITFTHDIQRIESITHVCQYVDDDESD